MSTRIKRLNCEHNLMTVQVTLSHNYKLDVVGNEVNGYKVLPVDAAGAKVKCQQCNMEKKITLSMASQAVSKPMWEIRVIKIVRDWVKETFGRSNI